MNHIAILLFALLPCQASEDSKVVIHSMECHPASIQFGDAVYVIAKASNPLDKPVLMSEEYEPCFSGVSTLKMFLIDSNNHPIPVLFEFEDCVVPSSPITCAEIQPGETRNVACLTMNVPPIEDLYGIPYWQEKLSNIPPEGEIFTLQITLEGLSSDTKEDIYHGRYVIVLLY